MKLNHGDVKATQGDTSHSQADMVAQIYAHIWDETRKVNAQRFEAAFYANPDLRSVRAPETPQVPTMNVQELLSQTAQSPELLTALSAMLAANRTG